MTFVSNSLIKNFPYKITVRKNLDRLIEDVVDVLEDRLRKRLYLKASKPLGLATGRTMVPIYKSLVARLIAWPSKDLKKLLKEWSSFNLDEYVGLVDGDPQSFRSYIMRYLGKPLNLTADQLKVPNGASAKPHDQADLYSNQLEKLGGISVQLLGLGSNGHVGFNEPPCGPKGGCRVVHLSEATREQNVSFFGNDLSKVPKRAITLGLKEILAAEEIHLIVTGGSKSQILNELLHSPCTRKLPASWLRLHGRVFLWADEAAFSL